MKNLKYILILLLLLVLVAPLAAKGPGGGGGKPAPESAGNNLSYPVIWAEGVQKVLPGTPGTIPLLGGEWWYSWGTTGTDPNVTPLACPHDPDEEDPLLNPYGLPLCDNEIEQSVDLDKVAGEGGNMDLVRAYLQKDQYNTWQASTIFSDTAPVNVHWIDWGDNLESVDWYTRSQVRTEVVLFQDLTTPVTEYEMRHTSGWGIDEVHGLAATLDEPPAAIQGPGDRATIFSPCARFMIQKLLVERDDPLLESLTWVPGEGWAGTDPGNPLINPPIFNMAVHEAADGPGFYNAEINVKGRIIYGYTWNVRRLNDNTGGTTAGDYRLTFSFDENCGGATELNTFFVEDVTQIIVPLETEEAIEAALRSSCIPTFPIYCRPAAYLAAEEGEEPGGGGTAVLIPAEYDSEGNLVGGNFTYMDVRILERGGGGGGGGGGGPKGPG